MHTLTMYLTHGVHCMDAHTDHMEWNGVVAFYVPQA